MIRNKNSVDPEIAQRHLVMREPSEESIFTHMKSILVYYGLSSILELLNKSPTKAAWTCTLNHKVHEMVEYCSGKSILEANHLQNI